MTFLRTSTVKAMVAGGLGLILLILILAWRSTSGSMLPEEEQSGNIIVEEGTPFQAEVTANGQVGRTEMTKVRMKNGDEGYTVRLKQLPKNGGPLTIKTPEGGFIALPNDPGPATQFRK